jgi:hypothetical protein
MTSTETDRSATATIRTWPEESREAAQLVIDTYGEPDEVTITQLVWHDTGAWKRIIATKTFFTHDFPAPHIDAIETVIDYRVPRRSSASWRPSTAASSSSAPPGRYPPAATTSRPTTLP